MKKFELIDIDEDNLPNVELSHEQKNKLKSVLKNNIKPYLSKNNNPIDINLKSSNILKTVDNLGDQSEEILNYIKGGKILRDLVVPALDADCPIPKEDILYKALFYIPVDYCFKSELLLHSNTVFAQRIYITKNELFIYNLDNYFRLIDKTILPIKYIKSAFIDKTYKTNYLPLSKNTLTITLDNSEKNDSSLPSVYFLINENGEFSPELEEFLKVLLKLGVKEDRINHYSISNIGFYIIGIISLIGLMYFIIFNL
ncbi:hypothetical protein [Clostridium sp. B9]|uniref:hypothetical protein n=1 Tax=Clostridium sp. B9 TaxID=3423224 RepID=UPI003D2F3676